MASRFSPADVQRLAALARLELTTDEIAMFATQLSGILAFAADVQGIPTDSIAPAANSTAVATLREDDVRPSLPREEILAGAPGADATAGLFTVPRVFTE